MQQITNITNKELFAYLHHSNKICKLVLLYEFTRRQNKIFRRNGGESPL